MEHVLPVYHELPANYLAPSVLQNMEQIKGKLIIFVPIL
jgi:hypothetical protein